MTRIYVPADSAALALDGPRTPSARLALVAAWTAAAPLAAVAGLALGGCAAAAGPRQRNSSGPASRA